MHDKHFRLRYTLFMIQLVTFLGNYGREYVQTRHNTAWQFADSLPFANKLFWQTKFKGTYTTVTPAQISEWSSQYKLFTANNGSAPRVPDTAPDKIYFLKPETYMNESGQSIIELVRFFKIKPENVLIVHDELELPCGTVSFKWSGGLGGHNGLRSTKAALNTADFWRLRFGISKPDGRDIADYVLSPFTADERIIMAQVFSQTAQLLVRALLASDPQRLISEWAKKKLSA